MQHRDIIIMSKIISEINIALDMTDNKSFNIFNSDEILKRTVCMTVINIGELVKSLSSEVRQQYSEIPWKAIAGFRDIAANKYQTLHMADVYKTVTEDFAVLKNSINNIIK